MSNSVHVRSRWFVHFFFASSTVYHMSRYAACAAFDCWSPLCFPYAPSIADWTTAGLEAERLIVYQLLVISGKKQGNKNVRLRLAGK